MHVFAPYIVIGITTLVRLCSNYICRTDNANFAGFFFFVVVVVVFFLFFFVVFLFDRDRSIAIELRSNYLLCQVQIIMFRELTVTNSSMLIRDFGDPLGRRQVDMLGPH